MKQFKNILELASGHVDAALQNTRVTIIEQDQNLKYVSIINPLTGYGDGLIGMSMSDVHGVDQAHELGAIRRLVLQDGISRHQHVSVLLDNETGCRHYFDTTIHALKQDGKITGVTTVSIDLTDIIEAKESLAEANKRLINVLEKTLI